MAQFEFRIAQGLIPKRPRFYQRAEGSPLAHTVVVGDPSLRLKNGCAQDDTINSEPTCYRRFKLSHCARYDCW